MKPSPVPDGIPVLSRGRHRTPRRGACFMELASVLAGERWSDHPSCTHPLLGQLARQVNDNTSDEGRQALAPMIPSVVGRHGNEQTWLILAVAVGAKEILEVPEPTQRVLAGGLLQAEQLCGDEPALAETRLAARSALDLVPGAVGWVERLRVRSRIDARTFARLCAPTMVRCAVDGVVTSGDHCDERLRGLLEAGIAACPMSPSPEKHVRPRAMSW